MKDKPAKKVAAKKKASVEETEAVLTEVPPIEDSAQLLVEVPPTDEDDKELINEDGPLVEEAPLVEEVPEAPLVEEPVVPVFPPEDFIDGPFVGRTPPREPKAKNAAKKKKPEEVRKYTPAQIKKLRGEYSRRTLQTRFGITF